ncbi:phosphatase PAP2 family protein [Methylovirgula sp. 4M-Z18]|uniref:phosphatase PAP2 family protein n=1 Tax=Methylovirgula sp. 4M-Z18 TaxID=2293567 RepID=UPI00131439BD|nr:phosphatase PAP2 family protein [Methylovirgula sp. 4M-Z18]
MTSNRVVLLSLAGLVLSAAVLAIWPELDLATSAYFYEGGHHFAAITPLGQFGRMVGYTVPFVLLIGATALWAARRFGFNVPFAPTGRSVAFLILSMVLVPGLVVNVGLKDHAHRPRPAQSTAFDGPYPFRPWYKFDGECKKNCSFVSGEASSAFWTLAPASLAPMPFKPYAIGAALIFSIFTSALRIAFGGHYLSDVLLATFLTIFLIEALRRWIFGANGSSG